jgi:hypothetical protein
MLFYLFFSRAASTASSALVGRLLVQVRVLDSGLVQPVVLKPIPVPLTGATDTTTGPLWVLKKLVCPPSNPAFR